MIVSIIATFLRQNGARLRGMWIGVGAGVVLSIAVGVILKLIEQSLPQSKQEAMESIIGGVAVFFVTGMILWMRTHARTMKADLQHAAASALRDGTTTALALMAFLAVLREGFETSVFLLATFSTASSAPAAMLGALLGILVAVGLGWGMYVGGVRLNLQRFFKVTGVFLVFVAAGLVLTAFRSAHEAGWVTVGQQPTVDLTWLTPDGTVRSALVTGVLGMPHDPRAIELLAWACYLVPMLALMFWPARLKPGRALAQRLRVAGAAVAVVGAVLLAVLVVRPQSQVPTRAPLAGGGTATVSVTGGTARLEVAGKSVALTNAGATSEDGADTAWAGAAPATSRPATLTLQQLVTLNGGRIPSGLDVSAAPGPYDASWHDGTALSVLTRRGGLVDAQETGQVTLTYSGGGLTTPRVLTLDGWQLAPSYVAATQASIEAVDSVAQDRLLWQAWVPVFLGLVAIGLLGQALRRHTQTKPASRVGPAVQAHGLEGTPNHADSKA